MTVLAGYAVLRFVCTLKEIEYVCNCAKVKGMYCQILYYLLIESEERLCQKMYMWLVQKMQQPPPIHFTLVFLLLIYLLIESGERLCQKMYVVGAKNATTTTYTFHTSIFASDS